MNNYLTISEKFTSIQGEGQTMGKKAIFLRLAGCNILCKSEHWVCDTIEVWKKGNKFLFEDVFTDEEIERLRFGHHLVITGGEPLLHQDKIIDFLYWFADRHEFIPITEIETNGTILIKYRLKKWVKYWNVSPKLLNSGVGHERFIPSALNELNEQEGSIFKFVVNSESDLQEIINYNVDRNKIYLMPAGSSREDLEITRPKTIEWCLKYNFNYSERLHIVIWNQKTGV